MTATPLPEPTLSLGEQLRLVIEQMPEGEISLGALMDVFGDEGLLLLTATPMMLEPYELYSAIELIEPGLYPTYRTFESSGERLPELNDLMRSLKGWEALPALDRTLAIERHAVLLEEVGLTRDELDDRGVREEAMNRLADRHPLAQVMVRNRKAEIGGFTRREARTVPVTLSDEERMEARLKFQQLPRNASPSRQRNRCALTGRPRGVFRKFGLGRGKLREFAMRGEVPGMTKSSW